MPLLASNMTSYCVCVYCSVGIVLDTETGVSCVHMLGSAICGVYPIAGDGSHGILLDTNASNPCTCEMGNHCFKRRKLWVLHHAHIHTYTQTHRHTDVAEFWFFCQWPMGVVTRLCLVRFCSVWHQNLEALWVWWMCCYGSSLHLSSLYLFVSFLNSN